MKMKVMVAIIRSICMNWGRVLSDLFFVLVLERVLSLIDT